MSAFVEIGNRIDRIIGKDRNEIKEKPSATGIPASCFYQTALTRNYS